MARIIFNSGDEFCEGLSRVAGKSEEISKAAIYTGAEILTDEIRKNLTANLNDPESASVRGRSIFKNLYSKTSGSLLEALGITPILQDENGVWNAKIGFGDPDYDPKGVPNLLKARVMESGSSTIRKRPFIRPAVTAKKKEVLEAMQQVVDDEIKKNMKG